MVDPLDSFSIYIGLFTIPTILNLLSLKFFIVFSSVSIIKSSPIFKFLLSLKALSSKAISPLFSGNLPSNTTKLFILFFPSYSINLTTLLILVKFASIL